MRFPPIVVRTTLLLAGLVIAATAQAGPGPSVTLTPVADGLVDVPALSTELLVVLALLMGVVVYRLVGANGFSRLSSVLAAGVLTAAAGGGAFYVHDVTASSPVTLTLSSGQTQAFNFNELYCVTNGENFDQRVSINLSGGSIPVWVSSCGYGSNTVGVCSQGLVLAASESCDLQVIP